MEIIRRDQYGPSVANPPPLPGKYGNWPDTKAVAKPPPAVVPPPLSMAYPYLKHSHGPASVA